jgi:hypothetical protein
MYIGGGFGPFLHPPVHESLTIAALIASRLALPQNTTYYSAVSLPDTDTLEILRGVIWNDDPACELFHSDLDNNFNLGIGKDWAIQFAEGAIFNADCTKHGAGKTNIIARSHFGDMQFLHSMANEPGEDSEDTRGKALDWLEFMYKVAIEEIPTTTQLGDVRLDRSAGASTMQRDEYPLRQLFHFDTKPSINDTIRSLLTADHLYEDAKLDYRAIGSCVHLIQDSFARGHTHRHVEADGPPKRFSQILNFHSFRGQDSEQHSKYDFPDEKLEGVDLSDLRRFDRMDGCRDAVDKSTTMINFWKDRAPWSQVIAWLEHDVFVLHQNVTPSNTNIE